MSTAQQAMTWPLVPGPFGVACAACGSPLWTRHVASVAELAASVGSHADTCTRAEVLHERADAAHAAFALTALLRRLQ